MSSAGFLRSAGVGRVIATMDPSDSRRGRLSVIDSLEALAAKKPLVGRRTMPLECRRLTPPPGRVSQVPGLICPRALSPFTPGSPVRAGGSLDSPTGGRLHHNQAGWPSSICVTRPKRVHAFALRLAGLRERGFDGGIAPDAARFATS